MRDIVRLESGHISGPPGANVMRCPLHRCDWWTFGTTEAKLREHLETHDVQEWGEEVSGLRSRAYSAEREVRRLRGEPADA